MKGFSKYKSKLEEKQFRSKLKTLLSRRTNIGWTAVTILLAAARNWKYMELIAALLSDENFEHSLDSFKHKFLLEYRIFFHLNNSDKTKNPNELKSQTSVVKILFT